MMAESPEAAQADTLTVAAARPVISPPRPIRRQRPRTPQRFPRAGLITELGGFNVLDQFGAHSPAPKYMAVGDHTGHRHVWQQNPTHSRTCGPQTMGHKQQQVWNVEKGAFEVIPSRRKPPLGKVFERGFEPIMLGVATQGPGQFNLMPNNLWNVQTAEQYRKINNWRG